MNGKFVPFRGVHTWRPEVNLGTLESFIFRMGNHTRLKTCRDRRLIFKKFFSWESAREFGARVCVSLNRLLSIQPYLLNHLTVLNNLQNNCVLFQDINNYSILKKKNTKKKEKKSKKENGQEIFWWTYITNNYQTILIVGFSSG